MEGCPLLVLLLTILMSSGNKEVLSLILMSNDIRTDMKDFDRISRKHHHPFEYCQDYCNVVRSEKPLSQDNGLQGRVLAVQDLLVCLMANQCNAATTVYRIQRNTEEIAYNCPFPTCQQAVKDIPLATESTMNEGDGDRPLQEYQSSDVVVGKRGYSDIADVCIEFHCAGRSPGTFGYLKCASDNRCLGR